MSWSKEPGSGAIVGFIALVGLGAALGGCDGRDADGTPGGTAGAGGSSGQVTHTDPGVGVELSPRAGGEAERTRLAAELAELEGLTAAELSERHAVSFEPAPSYDTAAIAGLELIQASSFQLSSNQLAELGARGFAFKPLQEFPSFAYGYSTIYMEDLPVYVSADSILSAVHESYDRILQALEVEVLSVELEQLLAGMQQRLAQGAGQELGASTVADADVFLSVARSLLSGTERAPVAGGSGSTVSKLVKLAQAASGTADVSLFGVVREDEDFSQFTPRGHYKNRVELERYFKAMMWLGRVDLRLIETQQDGSQVFRRRQADAMFLLRELVGPELRGRFDRLDATIAAFVGESDYMTLAQVDALAADLGLAGLSGLAAVEDERLAQAIIDGGYGEQRISSHIIIHASPDPSTYPLSRSFALLGQRYTVDSHVFSNVVYDRIGKRMMPSPLDVAFAALGNDQALALLAPELAAHDGNGYPAALGKVRALVDEHDAEYWDGSLYTRWLSALRTLSPARTLGDSGGLFPAARSEAWGRRLLNSQLASWAELRRDTILYVKQSYTSGAACEFPDAYVDPYPEFYAAIAAYGRRGAELLAGLDLGAPGQWTQAIANHFSLVTEVATRLQEMAQHQRTGNAFTPEMLAFINDAVTVQPNCDGQGGLFESGWYKQLFFDPSSALERNPVVADVHTQPTDEGGAPVGRVLHVGTGAPRAMVVVAETCSGPRAYAGLASSYFEKITEDFERLDDEAWALMVGSQPEVPWMEELLAPEDDR